MLNFIIKLCNLGLIPKAWIIGRHKIIRSNNTVSCICKTWASQAKSDDIANTLFRKHVSKFENILKGE